MSIVYKSSWHLVVRTQSQILFDVILACHYIMLSLGFRLSAFPLIFTFMLGVRRESDTKNNFINPTFKIKIG
jgi:hypothetical protein